MPCPICQLGNAQVAEANERFRVSCKRCGKFDIDCDAAEDWTDGILGGLSARQSANVSGWIFEHQSIHIPGNMLEFFKTIRTPTISERANKLLMALEKRAEKPGQAIVLHDTEAHCQEYLGAAWAVDMGELQFLAKEFLSASRNFLFTTTAFGVYAIKPEGYVYLENLRRANSGSDIGFAAMWFDQEMTTLWTDGIEPGILGSKYNPIRIDRHQHNNRIDDEIIAIIRKSRFVVADFTGHRGGVYFEAGYALGMGLPVIWTCREDHLDQLHFDARQYNFLTWNSNELNVFCAALQNRIEATIGRGNYDIG